MNNSHCLICNSADNVKIFIDYNALHAKRNIVKCKECNFVFFETDKNGKLDDSYWDNKQHIDVYENHEVQNGFEIESKKRIDAINELTSKGLLLDIGCGLGDFLRVARENGWKVCGVEISSLAAEYARRKYALDVHQGTIENCNFGSESIDVVTMWDVIEHVQNPIQALSAIRNKLKKGGMLVIKTPDDQSLFKSLSRFMYFISLKKISFLLKYVYYIPHYYYYNKRSLSRMLEKFGFKVINIQADETNYDFARNKIKLHYKKFFSKNIILLVLPLAYFFSRILKLQNKMIVYAVKE